MYFESIMEEVISRIESDSNTAEIPIWAAIAVNDEIISISGNMVEQQRSSLMHAEFIVVLEALQKLQTKYLCEASLYVTLEPCVLCSSVLEKVRIKDIFFGAYSPKTGAIVHGARVFETSLHKPNIIGGIQEERCSRILKKFFDNNSEYVDDTMN
ncbi:MAG: nucleoside deaminase [Holosporales bacterium]|jgi:tRNA(adenine34) deaminase|nr:nucleoside deaminase [Holosporales bacterium]